MDTIHSKMLLGFSIAICSLCYVVIVYFIVNLAVQKSDAEILVNREAINKLTVAVDEKTKDRYYGWEARRDREIILKAIKESCQ